MAEKEKLNWIIKFESIRHYMDEVSVEGQRTKPTQRKLANYDKYIAQVIRAGNCITLLMDSYPMDVTSFWNVNHLEKFVGAVYWTFNKSFLLKLLEDVEVQKPMVLLRCRELLLENPSAYSDPIPEDADDELKFCYRKDKSMKRSVKFRPMFLLDQQNRKSILEAVEKKIASFSPTPPDNTSTKPSPTPTVPFLNMVRPMDGDRQKTIEFMKAQVEKAGFKFPLFSKVAHLPNGKNPYGLNGAMAAMVRVFYDLNYFKKEYEFIDVFKSYLDFTGNNIGKSIFLEDYLEDRNFLKYSNKLKDLKISKLQ